MEGIQKHKQKIFRKTKQESTVLFHKKKNSLKSAFYKSFYIYVYLKTNWDNIQHAFFQIHFCILVKQT